MDGKAEKLGANLPPAINKGQSEMDLHCLVKYSQLTLRRPL